MVPKLLATQVVSPFCRQNFSDHSIMPLYLQPGIQSPLDVVYTSEYTFRSCYFIIGYQELSYFTQTVQHLPFSYSRLYVYFSSTLSLMLNTLQVLNNILCQIFQLCRFRSSTFSSHIDQFPIIISNTLGVSPHCFRTTHMFIFITLSILVSFLLDLVGACPNISSILVVRFILVFEFNILLY